MERLQSQLQEAVNATMENIDKSRLSALKQRTYLEMAKCFDEKGYDANNSDNCIRMASNRVTKAESIVMNELNGFQARIQRCSADCQDEVKDTYPDAFTAQGSQASRTAAEKRMVVCATSCVDKHVALLKGMQAKIEAEIDAISR